MSLAQEATEDPTLPKEVNYRKYIGEQVYVRISKCIVTVIKIQNLPFKTRVKEPFVVGQTIHAVGTLSDKPHR